MNDAKQSVLRALEIGCVVHTCSALPGAMCNTTPDNHGPPSDMDPEKAPWYGVHHRRWLTWLRDHKHKHHGYVQGVLTAAEQVYACDVCEAPVNVPCLHMRGPGLGKGETKNGNAMYPNAPLKIEGRVFTQNGYETVQMTVTDPVVIAKLKAGGQEISMGYRDGKPYLKEPPGLRAATVAAGIDPDVETSAPTPEQLDRRKALTDFIDTAVVRGDIHGRPTPDDGKTGAQLRAEKQKAGFDQLYAEVPTPMETFKTISREEFQRRAVLKLLEGVLAAGSDADLVRAAVAKIVVALTPQPWVSGGASEIVDLTPPETYAAMERDLRSWMRGSHLRSVPMNPDDVDTVVARPSGEPEPHPFKPALVEDGVSCEDCGLPKEAHHKRTMFSSLEWFKEQAARALKVNPSITMLEFIERLPEPEYETAAQRAFHLEEGELEIALRNVGCDLRCGACAETFFTGSTDLVHRCAMLSKLKCIMCDKPAVPKSQLCEGHERQEHDEIEGHIQASRELNGSSAETRKFAIARMNELDRHPSLYGHTLEGLCGQLAVLLQIAGVKPEQVNSFQQFFYQTVKAANERTPGPDNDPYGEVIAHARGIVLGIQMLREGPQEDAPSPLKLMLKTPEPKA